MRPETSIEFLDRLVAFPSVFTEPDNSAIADFALDRLRELGFTCHRMTGARPGRAGVFASLGPTDSGGVLLSAHLDVVPAAHGDWRSDPFRLTRRNRRLYGRGTTDMKGFAAAALAAAVRAAEAPLKAPLKLALSYDEEAGCVGIAEMIGTLDQTIGRPDVCIVGEPTSMRIATGHKGKQSYRVTCTGSAGHSASAPNYLNALHVAVDTVGILRRLQADLAAHGLRDEAYDVPYTTVHVGRLSGGTSLNVVPDRAELEFEIRHLASEAPQPLIGRLEAELNALVVELRPEHPAAAVALELFNAYPGLETPEDSPAVALARALGGKGPLTKVSYGTEAGFFQQELGIPTVVCGPGDMAQGHKPDEFIEEEQIAACDRMLDNLIDQLA